MLINTDPQYGILMATVYIVLDVFITAFLVTYFSYLIDYRIFWGLCVLVGLIIGIRIA